MDVAHSFAGLVRQRYDFDVDIGKIDYTRIINSSTILEFSTGFFNSIENGPPEDDVALAGIQRASYPQLARLGQFAGQHNPLGLIPSAVFGNIQSADRTQSNDGGTAWITTDPAPIRLWAPMVTGPSTVAPVATITKSSSVGWRFPLLSEVPPSVTPW